MLPLTTVNDDTHPCGGGTTERNIPTSYIVLNVACCTARSISKHLRVDQGPGSRVPGKEAGGRVRVREHTSSAGVLVPQNPRGVSGTEKQFPTVSYSIHPTVNAVRYTVRLSLSFCSSRSYLHRYLTDIEHDNAYVSKYYRRVDARREKAGKRTLLPLKKIEQKRTIDLGSYRLTSHETNDLVG